MYNIVHQCTFLSKVYNQQKNRLDIPTQDGDRSERVSLPMGDGSSQTRLVSHPNIAHIVDFWHQVLSYQSITSSVLIDLIGFHLDQREGMPSLRGIMKKKET
jgi:hypothetical protein